MNTQYADESPVTAVTRVLAREGITPSNLLVIMLINAVRDTTPPPNEITIGMLTKILQALEPAQAVDAWADRSSREIVSILSRRPEVRRVAELSDDERIWCTLEGVIASMLLRVCRGQDLYTVDNTTRQQVPDLGLRPAESAAPTVAPGGPFPRTVTCVWCGNRYVSAIPVDLDEGTCGCNCACDVRFRNGHWDVFCGYGSEHDMDILRFVANPPSAPADPICDECIRERILCGDIIRLDEALTEPAQPTEIPATALDNPPPREATQAVGTGTIAALAEGIVAAGGTLPYPGIVTDASGRPTDLLPNPQGSSQ